MMRSTHLSSMMRTWLAVVILLVFTVMPAFSGGLNLVYEQVVEDSWGNEIGYRKVSFSKPSDLPAGSSWQKYLQSEAA